MRYSTEKECRVVHKCGHCGKKMTFISTRRFRVNANKNKLEFMQMYHVKNCMHTLNILIY